MEHITCCVTIRRTQKANPEPLLSCHPVYLLAVLSYG